MSFFVRDSAGTEFDTIHVDLHGNGVLAVQNDRGEINPSGFYLNPIYPNPFNSQVKLSYGLILPSQISLRVYDTSGRLVTMLYEGIRSAGAHTVTWDGSDVQSGIYLIQLTSSGSSEVRKVVLVR